MKWRKKLKDIVLVLSSAKALIWGLGVRDREPRNKPLGGDGLAHGRGLLSQVCVSHAIKGGIAPPRFKPPERLNFRKPSRQATCAPGIAACASADSRAAPRPAGGAGPRGGAPSLRSC